MKRIWLILSITFLLQPLLPVIEYAANYDYIATVLCINKDKPAMSCNGKCHLGTEMAKELGANDEKLPNNKPAKDKKDIQLFFSFNILTDLENKVFKELKPFINYKNIIYSLEFTKQLFQPPETL